jgi:hypothetical protein
LRIITSYEPVLDAFGALVLTATCGLTLSRRAAATRPTPTVLPDSWWMSNVIGCTILRQGYGVAGVAIERFTNQVIDKQIEVVTE